MVAISLQRTIVDHLAEWIFFSLQQAYGWRARVARQSNTRVLSILAEQCATFCSDRLDVYLSAQLLLSYSPHISLPCSPCRTLSRYARPRAVSNLFRTDSHSTSVWSDHYALHSRQTQFWAVRDYLAPVLKDSKFKEHGRLVLQLQSVDW